MGKNQSKQLEGKWVVATDALEDGEKKFVETKMVEHNLFAGYTLHTEEMLGLMQKGSYQNGQYLFQAGQPSDALFIVLRGSCDILQRGGKKIGVYNVGSIIGDTGLEQGIPRTFSVRCSSPQCDVLRLSKRNFDNIMAEMKHRKESRNFKTLANASIFFSLPMECIRRIEDIAEEKTFHEGNVIIKKEGKGKHFYIIKSGQIKEENYNGIADTSKLGQYCSFGEEAILSDEISSHYNATVTAVEYTSVLAINASKLEDIVTDNVIGTIQENVSDKLKILKRLRSNPDFILNATVNMTHKPESPGADPKGPTSTISNPSTLGRAPTKSYSLADILADEAKTAEETKDDSDSKGKKKDESSSPLLDGDKKKKKDKVKVDTEEFPNFLMCCAVPEGVGIIPEAPQSETPKKEKKSKKSKKEK